MITNNSDNGHMASAIPSKPLISELYCIVKRHKWKMVAVFSLTLALLVLGLIAFPRSYTSEARLFIRLGKESVALDPTATMNEVINVNDSRENEINSEIEILRSRVLLEDVVEKLGPDGVLSGDGNGKDNFLNGLLTPLKGAIKSLHAGDISLTERAVNALEKSITVNSPRKSNILVISCKAGDPKQAQRILSAFTNSYMVRHTEVNRTSGSYDFFAEQAELIHGQLTKAEGELRDAKNGNNIASVEGQQQNLEDQANTIEVAILKNQRALASSKEKVALLTTMLDEFPKQELAEESTVPSAAVDAMRNELYKLQIQEKAASAQNTALHPNVISLRRQVEDTQRILETEEASRNQPTRKLSVVHQMIQTELAATRAETAAHRAEADLLAKQFDAVQSKIREFNDHQTHIAGLSRQTELLENDYRTYATSRERARIDGALETSRISNVNVVQKATFVAKPSSPNIVLGLALAFALAVCSSVLVTLVSEQLAPLPKSVERFERDLQPSELSPHLRGARREIVEC